MTNIRIAILVVGLLFLSPVVLGSGQQEQAQDPEQTKQQEPGVPTRPNRGSAEELGLGILPEDQRARSRSEALRKSARRKAFEVPPPADVAAPPEDAMRTESGLAYRMLESVDEQAAPTANDRVMVLYTGWTTDGVAFDTTEDSGKPREFYVNKVVPGFSEALQLLSPGEKGRFWVPAELGYQDMPGRPQGMLVFDVQLISITRAPEPPANLVEPPAEAQRTESGLAYQEIRPGSEERPGPTDMVLVHVNVWTPDGSLFDSSVMRDTPINFRLDLTVPAFAELLPLMGRGAKWWIWSPQEMATLDENSNVDSPLVFEVELLEFLVLPETPPDVSAPPRDARKTFLGVSYTVLQPGTGDRRPKSGEWVEVHYAGWTRDGEMFDSSFDYGRPRSFPVNEKMPPGWNDVLKEMRVGEKRRVWIPEDLAVSQHKDRPMGTLVFDIELLSIRESE